MTASEIARSHFEAAMQSADSDGQGRQAVARNLMAEALKLYLQSRTLDDVRSELIATADNLDPDTDYVFMRP